MKRHRVSQIKKDQEHPIVRILYHTVQVLLVLYVLLSLSALRDLANTGRDLFTTDVPLITPQSVVVLCYVLILVTAVFFDYALQRRELRIPFIIFFTVSACAILLLYAFLFQHTVSALAARHLDEGSFYAHWLTAVGVNATALFLLRMMRGKPVPHIAWFLSTLCLFIGLWCKYLASITPCCTGG